MKTNRIKPGIKISSTYGMKESKHQTVWVVVGHRAGAQVFCHEGKELTLLQDFLFPDGKSKENKLVSDRPGRSFDSFSKSRGGHQTGGPRHAMSSKESPSDHAMTVFSETIADWLESARKENKFDKLILIAEPRFIGRLKSHLSTPTLQLVISEKEKDYSWLKKPELERRLLDLFPEKRSRTQRILPTLHGAYGSSGL